MSFPDLSKMSRFEMISLAIAIEREQERRKRKRTSLSDLIRSLARHEALAALGDAPGGYADAAAAGAGRSDADAAAWEIERRLGPEDAATLVDD